MPCTRSPTAQISIASKALDPAQPRQPALQPQSHLSLYDDRKQHLASVNPEGFDPEDFNHEEICSKAIFIADHSSKVNGLLSKEDICKEDICEKFRDRVESLLARLRARARQSPQRKRKLQA